MIDNIQNKNPNNLMTIIKPELTKQTQTGNEHKKKNTLKGNLITLVLALLIAMVIRSFAFEPFSIPSGSMIPTLLVGDYLFVSKYSYGYSRYSLPFGVPLIKDRIWYTEPQQGDVIVFRLPSDNKTDYIKRLIGKSGDTIQVKEGRLYINGKIVPRNKVGETTTLLANGIETPVTIYNEILPNGTVHPIYEVSDKELFDNTAVYTVPDGYFFMMGDNRDNSLDSRSDKVGFVPTVNLVGKAQNIFFSKEQDSSLLKFWNWPSDIRLKRFFNSID